MKLVAVIEEMDVSGGTPLDRRAGLREAVERIEAGEANVLIVAYFDRLVRSLEVQRQVIERVEAAGGSVLAVDIGRVTNASAGQWLSGTMIGAVSEYHRRVTAERTEEAKRRAIERGVPTFDRIPPGYRRRPDRTLEPDPETASVVADAFAMRAEGTTIVDIREFLREHGIERSYHGTQSMLGSRIYLGELRFGNLFNADAHSALVTEDLFRRVQAIKSPRGPRPKSERLLARLGVLRCGTCGSRLVVGFRSTRGGKRYDHYRCSPLNDCAKRVTISADLIETAVVERVREAIEGMRGTASMDDGLADAEADLARREDELDAAVRAFEGFEDVAATRERLTTLRGARDAARQRVEELRVAVRPAISVGSGDWDHLTLHERRALIRAVVERVDVAPGRDAERVAIHLFGE